MSYFDKPITADASQAQQAFVPIPEGVYKLLIEKAEEGKSKAGNAMLKLAMKVEEGEHAERKLFANVNLEHPNPKVVEIGTRQLHALLLMSGLAQIKDATDLIGRSIKARVKVQKREDTGELQNEVVLALRKDSDTTPQTPAAPTGTAPKAADKSTW